MGNSLEDLANVRRDLLLAEAAAWIHDMGKCDDRHIEKSALDGNQTIPYDYKTAYLSKVSNIQLSLLGESVPFDELIEYGMPEHFINNTGKPLLVRLLGLCHGVAHTEKAEIYVLAQQKAADTRLSIPFGHEFDPLKGLQKKLDTIDFNTITTNPIEFKSEVETAFRDTVGDTRRPLNDVTLWIWSHTVATFYKAALASVVLGYQEDLSKLHWRLLSVRINGLQFLENVDRIPDLLARQKLLKDGLGKVRDLLTVEYPLGTEVYSDENGSIFIVPDRADLLELQDKLSKTLRQRILDAFSSGIVPKKEHVQLDGEIVPDVQLHDPWPSKEEPLGEEPWKDGKNLYPPPLLPLDQQLLRIPTNHANIHKLNHWWSNGIHDRCSVCQLRPQGWKATGIKALERKVCAICEERREDRSQQWARDLKSTIWIDEVADANGRVALIAGKFSLERWLDGEMVFYPAGQGEISAQIALKVKNMGGLLTKGQILRIRNNDYEWDDSLGLLKSRNPSEIRETQIPSHFYDDRLHIDDTEEDVQVLDVQRLPDGMYRVALNKLPEGRTAGSNLSIQHQVFKMVGDGKYVETASDQAAQLIEGKILHSRYLMVEKVFRLYLQSFSMYQMKEAQTPARLFRVWETTQTFWKSVVSDFGKSHVVDMVPGRLQIEGTFTLVADKDSLGVSHTYELKLGNTRLSIVCKSPQIYLTVDNLRRTAKLLGLSEEQCKNATEEVKYQEAAKYLQKCLENGQFDIEEPTGYGSANKTLGTLHITSVEPEKTPYVPAIPILTEPRTFMALVPADKAIQVVEDIKKKYEAEMGKVRNRLPLTVGVVFAGRRTPLPAILDAGRRMLKQPTETTGWLVKDVNLSSYPEKASLTLGQEEDESPTLTLDVPAIMGDEITEDVWYPYWCLESEAEDAGERLRKFKSSDSKYWVHVSELKKGDTVSFMPSRLDFEFLDTASRRFEVSYKDGKRRGLVHPARPYYLEQFDDIEELWTILKKGLATTQIDNLVGLIETKRMEWLKYQDRDKSDFKEALETFEKVVEEIIRNAEWRTEPDIDKLVMAAVSGQLADVFELHMTILKERGNE